MRPEIPQRSTARTPVLYQRQPCMSSDHDNFYTRKTTSLGERDAGPASDGIGLLDLSLLLKIQPVGRTRQSTFQCLIEDAGTTAILAPPNARRCREPPQASLARLKARHA